MKVKEKVEKELMVTVTIPNVPIKEVHDKVKLYRRKIMAERQQDYGLMQAYTEWLKESMKHMPV